MAIPDQLIENVPARIHVPAQATFDVFDKNNNLVAHNTTPSLVDRDVLLDSTARIGNGVDPARAPFVVKFSEAVLEQPNQDDAFPEGV